MKKQPAIMVLEDGTVFKGTSFGAKGEVFAEAVFNTSMAGYQEIITDPSYKGQFVVMTYPLIGNYGVNKDDVEASKPHVEGFVVRECSRVDSNWRSEGSLHDYLKKNKVVGIEGVDTRAITRHIREEGAMRAVISTRDFDEKSLLKKVKKSPGLIGRDLVKDVVSKKAKKWNKNGKYRVVVIDCGTKYNILRELAKRGAQVTVVPAKTSADDIMKLKPDGLMLSNGPGDPAAVKYVIRTTQNLLGKIPIFGICLGHQMLGLALGAKTYKLKFGHHGANHPVKDLRTGKIAITVQNHGFCVDMDTLDKKDIETTHINLNDNTLEGLKHKKMPVFAVQFHPEASPGPNDAKYVFDEFIKMMERKIAQKKRH